MKDLTEEEQRKKWRKYKRANKRRGMAKKNMGFNDWLCMEIKIEKDDYMMDMLKNGDL